MRNLSKTDMRIVKIGLKNSDFWTSFRLYRYIFGQILNLYHFMETILIEWSTAGGACHSCATCDLASPFTITTWSETAAYEKGYCHTCIVVTSGVRHHLYDHIPGHDRNRPAVGLEAAARYRALGTYRRRHCRTDKEMDTAWKNGRSLRISHSDMFPDR